jgi:hypothetical protein
MATTWSLVPTPNSLTPSNHLAAPGTFDKAILKDATRIEQLAFRFVRSLARVLCASSHS